MRKSWGTGFSLKITFPDKFNVTPKFTLSDPNPDRMYECSECVIYALLFKLFQHIGCLDQYWLFTVQEQLQKTRCIDNNGIFCLEKKMFVSQFNVLNVFIFAYCIYMYLYRRNIFQLKTKCQTEQIIKRNKNHCHSVFHRADRGLFQDLFRLLSIN